MTLTLPAPSSWQRPFVQAKPFLVQTCFELSPMVLLRLRRGRADRTLQQRDAEASKKVRLLPGGWARPPHHCTAQKTKLQPDPGGTLASLPSRRGDCSPTT